ncbi:MAG: CZB domain-containing protein [Magnetococcales bacterium]|nr:CZB domain-containing protein [Magnetococcales bacterium]
MTLRTRVTINTLVLSVVLVSSALLIAAQLTNGTSNLGMLFLAGFVLVGIGGVAGALLAGQISKAFDQIHQTLLKLADGDLASITSSTGGSSEDSSVIARDINQMTSNLSAVVQKVHLHANTVAACVVELDATKEAVSKEAVQTLSASSQIVRDHREVTTGINAIQTASQTTAERLVSMSSASHQLHSNIQSIAHAAEEARYNISALSGSAGNITINISNVNESLGQVNQSVHTVASSVNDVTSALIDIRRRSQAASNLSSQANNRASEANQIMEKMRRSADKIGTVVEVINNIAEQTNMLALNASIEAAGAGDAGKGFAVVANEVKDLARQTSDATQMISKHIDEIQEITDDVGDANEAIGRAIQEISDATVDISDSVEEQSDSVQDISRAISDVAEAADQVTHASQALDSVAQEVSTAAQEAEASTTSIAQSSSEASEAASELSNQTSEISAMAEEVSTAAQQSASATDNANTMIGTIHNNTEVLTGLVNNIALLIETLDHPQQKLLQAIEDLDAGPAPFPVRDIKSAHLGWLRKLENVIRGRSELQADQVASANECLFGKWYDTEGSRLCSDSTTFQNVGQIHRKVHQVARESVALANEGDVIGATENMAKFNTLKDQLFEELDRLYLELT